jgi:hypothetical protein
VWLHSWTQTRKILSIESAKGRFDGRADADNSFFHTRTQESNPKVTAKEQPRPARRRWTARMPSTVKVHPFRRRHCRIQQLRAIRAKRLVLLHLTLKTRNSPRLDVGFIEKPLAVLPIRVSDFYL